MRSLFLVAALSSSVPRCGSQSTRLATLNLENYPRHAEQGPAAMAMLQEFHASSIAMQEITNPTQFAALARETLGPEWTFVWADAGWIQRVGLLVDTRRFTVQRQTVHRETLIHRGARPVLEVVLVPRSRWGGRDGTPIHVFVAHLKSGSDSEPVRARQLAALEPILAARAAEGAAVVLMGDLNSTSTGDRERLAALAQAAGLSWASEGLECTSYWERRTTCSGHALDHVLSWAPPRTIAVGGACATEGCDPGEQCPLYRSQISDHCPIVVELALP